MKDFQEVAFDQGQCGLELEEFGRLLASRVYLSERRDVLPFFRERRHLSAFLSSYHPALWKPEQLLAYEYKLFGDFGADLVVGSRSRAAFCFVEFGDAAPGSIFSKRGRELPVWSARFNDGFSQIVDWFWKLSELQHTPDFVRRFGTRPANFMGMLVIGRSADLQPREVERLDWFNHNVIVNSKHVYCCTFDTLYHDLKARLSFLSNARYLS